MKSPSNALVCSFLLLGLSGDKLSEADLLDHLADGSVLEVEVLDLELGSLGNEVHLPFSFLQYIILNRKESAPPLAT